MIPIVHNVYEVFEMVVGEDKRSLSTKRIRQRPWTWEEAQNFVKEQEHPIMFQILPKYK